MMNSGNRKVRMELTVMMLILLEGSLALAESNELELSDPNDLYLSSSSTPVPFSDYTDESSLRPSEPNREAPAPGNTSSKLSKLARVIPIRDSLYVVIPMTVIYSLILLTGLVGNVSTCVVIARNTYMHTATNYYLFSLAISDLLLLLSGLPQEMYMIWIRYPYVFGETFCVIRGLAAETSANATVLTITAFTVERYVAICHPLRSHKYSQLSRVVRGVKAIWVIALTLALPQAAQFGIIDEKSGDTILIKGAWCSIKRVIIPYAFEISICVFFVIPMSLITGLYVLIGLKLWRSRRGPARPNSENNLSVEPHRFTSNRHSQTHVIRMLVSVVVAFFVCWAPFHSQRLLAVYASGTKSKTLVIIYDSLTHISGILYFLSTCINPILYHIMSNKFRQAFRDTSAQLCGRRPTSGLPHRTYSAISNRSSRMGVVLQNNLGHGQRVNRAEHHDTCVNCRHTPSLCSCRGNNKFIRTYATPNSGHDESGGNSTSASPYLHNSSSSDKEVVIALSTLGSKSQGSVFVAKIGKCNSEMDGAKQKGSNFRKPSGLRAFLTRTHRQRSRACKGQANSKLDAKSNGFMHQLRGKPRLSFSAAVPEKGTCSQPQVPLLGSTVSRSIVILDEGTTTDSGGASQSSVASGPSITSISNSSLQDMDPSEYTGEELASCLARMSDV